MVKIRSGLPIALVLLLVVVALSAPVASQMAIADVNIGGCPYADRTSTVEGEPDASQNGKSNPAPPVKPSSDMRQARSVGTQSIRQVTWIRWTRAIWMARYLGVGI